MKKIFISFVLLSIAVLTISNLVSARSDLPKTDPGELWNYITKISPYQEWQFWSDHQGMQPGRAPHGPLHKVYANDRLYSSTKPPVQYGSIQVKENYSESKELLAITVMYKVIDYNPDAGDWFWVKYSPEGKAEPYGKPTGCIGCHSTKANNDFIIVHEFK